MWWNSMPPWMQQGGGMTPGAGMPPSGGQSHAPMNMNPVQMGPPGSIPGAPPPPGQAQQPINPAQMGMLSQMLAQQTRGPGAMAGAASSAPGQAGPAAGAQQQQGAGGVGQDAMLGWLRQMGII